MTLAYSTVDILADFMKLVTDNRPLIMVLLAVYLIWLGVPDMLELLLDDGDL